MSISPSVTSPTARSPSPTLNPTPPNSGVGKTPSKPSPLTTTSVTARPANSQGDADVVVASTSVCNNGSMYDRVVLDAGQESKKSPSLVCGTSTPIQAEDDQQAEPSQSVPPMSGVDATSTENDPLSLVLQIFSNWPCIVATVLGYTPTCLHSTASLNEQRGGRESLAGSSDQQHMKPGHVTVLDAFLQKLLYSRNTQLINTFFTTVIEKMTDDLQKEDAAQYFQKNDGSCSFEEIPLLEHTVGLVVGSVLIRAMVRLLTVEHSRPLGATAASVQPGTPNEASDNAEDEDLDPPPPPPPPLHPGRRQQQLSQNSSMEEKAQTVYSIIK